MDVSDIEKFTLKSGDALQTIEGLPITSDSYLLRGTLCIKDMIILN